MLSVFLSSVRSRSPNRLRIREVSHLLSVCLSIVRSDAKSIVEMTPKVTFVSHFVCCCGGFVLCFNPRGFPRYAGRPPVDTRHTVNYSSCLCLSLITSLVLVISLGRHLFMMFFSTPHRGCPFLGAFMLHRSNASQSDCLKAIVTRPIPYTI